GQLRLTHEQIQHKDKLASLGEMAACVAHELNNPLSSISFAVQVLLRDAPTGGRQRQHLELIYRNSLRIQRLAEGLTSFARPSESASGQVGVDKAVDDALTLLDHEFRSRRIAVRRSTAPGVPRVWASESQLNHVFVNLLRNAAHAIESRKEAAGAEAVPAGEVAVEVQTIDDRFVGVSVSDNGSGIHPDYEERLFTPFFTTKPRGRGTGLGLYIVKQIVDSVNGRIELRSSVGEGTTFHLLLPHRRGDDRGA
ncbi:MAG: sensor histidine kinase, partial [Deferrisomatales bacterium]